MTITKSGELASFYTVNKAPIKHLKVHFSPKQAGSGDPSLENIRPIEGWNEILYNINSSNLLTYWRNGYYSPTRDTWINSANNACFYPIKVKQGDIVTFTCSHKFTSGSMYLFDFRTTYTMNASTYIKNYSLSNMLKTTKTITADGYIVIQLDYQSTRTATNAFEWSPQITINNNIDIYDSVEGICNNINWSNDIGTIYGGYVDLITGELTQTYTINQLTLTNIYSSNDQYFWYTTTGEQQIPPIANENTGLITDRLQVVSGLGVASPENQITFYANGIIRWKENGTMTLTDYRTYLANNPITICYQLATPISYQLTPTQLQTFIGQNNIWSNADRVEVEYDLAESNDELYRRRNIILQSAPHLETVSGNIANFNTDLIAPIKEAKIYFEPIQEGSGTPSLENVREIIGYTGLNIYSGGNNIIEGITLYQSKYLKPSDGTEVSWGNNWYDSDYVTVLPNTDYILQCNCNGIADAGVVYYDNNKSFISGTITNNSKTNIFLLKTPSNAAYLRFTCVLPNENPVAMYTATDYLQYGGKTIPITFPTVRKNLLDITRTEKINPGASTSNITISNGVISIDAVASSARSYVLFAQDFPAGTYTIQVQKSGAVGNPRLLTTSEISNSSYNTYYTLYSRQMASDSLTFTLTQTSKIGLVLSNLTNESGNSGTLYDIQLEQGSTATTYEPYNNTIYGGYVNLINGNIVSTYRTVELSSLTWGRYSNIAGNFYNNSLINYDYNQSNKVLCDKLPVAHSFWTNGTVMTTNRNQSTKMIGITNTNFNGNPYSDINGFIAWLEELNPILVYPTIDEIVIGQLTPQQLLTLRGTNNIWSNANGPVEIKYWTH